VIGLGAPIIGTALGGPLGGAAGKLLAEALGAVAATPAAVQTAIQAADPTAATVAVQAAEQKWAEAIAAEAETAKAQVAAVGETQRAEIASADPLQRWWRPLFALELSLLECPAFAATLLHALWTGFAPGINGFGSLSGLLMAYFGARFGVLGVYVHGRTQEKIAGAVDTAGSVAEPVVKVIGKKK
jgi:hypothetical protein